MKKKDKDIVRKPDVFITWFTSTTEFIRKNSKLCIIGLVVILVAAAGVYTYMLHLNSQYDKIQYQLVQGIQSFDEYNASKKEEDIAKAEGIFKDIAQKKMRQSQYVAKLYLAKINYVRGKNEDAKKIYEEIIKGTPSSILKTLSEKAIQHIDKKQ